MSRFTHLFVLFSLLALLGGCTALQKDAHLLNNVTYSSVLEVPFTAPTEVLAYGEDTQQKVWYWQANPSQSMQGVVVMVHGGCWLSQFDITHTQGMASALADEGYAVWNIEYRRSGNGGQWPVALEDIRLGIAALNQQKGNEIDLSNISILGHSAGGHLGMLAAGDINALRLPSNSRIQVLGLAPIVDISAYAMGNNSCQSAAPAFMGGTVSEQAAKYEAANVLNVSFDEKLMVYSLAGGQDTIVPPNFTFHPQAQSRVIEQAGHFDWIHPDTHAFKLVLSLLEQ
ncbi:alpha/beta hydrolase [Glaciecola sp. XM2]|uniref:alpha/beta hydrolase n=1 Tax=Glaciecola sp. XM2 TaxID=1914931 RepID=UPI001BDEB90F|nr:alpha/beta hydrolase [Glaciecola sp. XM2]MBT1450597.1 alpha/beta hydrolase [Glaciecola sp. XM2]